MPLPSRWGSEFQISTTSAPTQALTSVTRLDNGQTVVSWTETSGANGDIKFRILNADGSPFSAELRANIGTVGNQLNAKVAALAGGKFVIAWEDYSAGDGGNIRYRVFNPDGTSSMGADATVYDGAVGQGNNLAQQDVQVAARADGTFMIGWWDGNTGNTSLASSSGAMVRTFDNNGSGLTSNAVRVSGNWGGDFGPVIATSGTDIAFVWDDDLGPINSQNGDDSIYFRTWSGALPGTNFSDGGTRVNGGIFRESVVTPDAAYTNLGLVIVWKDDQASITVGDDIFIRFPNGTIAQVNTTVVSDQSKPAVAALAGGGFVVVWTDFSGPGGADVRAHTMTRAGMLLILTSSSRRHPSRRPTNPMSTSSACSTGGSW